MVSEVLLHVCINVLSWYFFCASPRSVLQTKRMSAFWKSKKTKKMNRFERIRQFRENFAYLALDVGVWTLFQMLGHLMPLAY